MAEGKPKEKHWWSTFQTAKYPAYVEVLDPDGIQSLDLAKPKCRVKRILMDDILDSRAYKDARAPATFEIQEGSFILLLPEDAGSAQARLVSPPWLCRVNSIWFKPEVDSGEYTEPKGTTPDVVEWEAEAISTGRVAAQHLELQVTYFYRWPDFVGTIKNEPDCVETLSQALCTLGIAESGDQVRALLNKRGCGNTPATHFGMRYVMYSNHETGSPNDDSDEDDGDDNIPVPLESVMGVANVLFLDSISKLPYLPAAIPAAAAAASAASAPRTGNAALPASERKALGDKRRRLVPGFICNLFLVTGDDAEPQLFGLSEWANGTAGQHIKKPWVARSRRQVKELLKQSKADLKKQAEEYCKQLYGPDWAPPPRPATGEDPYALLRDSDEADKDNANEGIDDELMSAEDLEQPQAAAAAGAAPGRARRGSRRLVMSGLSSDEDDREHDRGQQEVEEDDELQQRSSDVQAAGDEECDASEDQEHHLAAAAAVASIQRSRPLAAKQPARGRHKRQQEQRQQTRQRRSSGKQKHHSMLDTATAAGASGGGVSGPASKKQKRRHSKSEAACAGVSGGEGDSSPLE